MIQTPEGVRIAVTGYRLPPGGHGLHVHAVGLCEPPDFTSAGAHFNPGNKQHGTQNPAGAHAGDLPNLVVAASGEGGIDVTTKAFTLAGGTISLFGDKGTSLVVHANPDDRRRIPPAIAAAASPAESSRSNAPPPRGSQRARSLRPGPLVVSEVGSPPADGHPVRTPTYRVDKLSTRCLVSAAPHPRGARRGGEMAKRLLVTSAGTGPSNNLIRSLRAGHPSVVVIGAGATVPPAELHRRSPIPGAAAGPVGPRRGASRGRRRSTWSSATDADTIALSRMRAGSRATSSCHGPS